MGSIIDRRTFIKSSAAAAATVAMASPLRLVRIASGEGSGEPFLFAYISDSHLTYLGNGKFTEMFIEGLERAVTELEFMEEEPDFVFYGGDLAQLGRKEELDKGAEILAKVAKKIYYVMGEHDYYLDLGEYWRKLFGKEHYSFDHKGIHFVVLNSILTYKEWIQRWPTPMDRMKAMAQLDNPKGSPFMVGKEQIQWLKEDLARYSKDTPIVVLSHSPLYKYYKPWNFWTDDAEEVQAVLRPFKQVTVIHGHIHQVATHRTGNITFHGIMSTAWPWPYPPSRFIPPLTVPMNRANPFTHYDGCGWGWISVRRDRKIVKHYELWENEPLDITPEVMEARERAVSPPALHY
jgi:3',5'-cyclic AMP phosphodiesterase CpdA